MLLDLQSTVIADDEPIEVEASFPSLLLFFPPVLDDLAEDTEELESSVEVLQLLPLLVPLLLLLFPPEDDVVLVPDDLVSTIKTKLMNTPSGANFAFFTFSGLGSL